MRTIRKRRANRMAGTSAAGQVGGGAGLTGPEQVAEQAGEVAMDVQYEDDAMDVDERAVAEYELAFGMMDINDPAPRMIEPDFSALWVVNGVEFQRAPEDLIVAPVCIVCGENPPFFRASHCNHQSVCALCTYEYEFHNLDVPRCLDCQQQCLSFLAPF